MRWGPPRCFYRDDLYSTQFGDWKSTEIEEKFFLITLESKLHLVVRRAKAPFLSGCESRPATVAPAGSSRSG